MRDDLPSRVTKYFKVSDRKYYEEGQFKFGTLEEYRDQESWGNVDARHDEREGVTRRNYDVNISLSGTYNAGGNIFQGPPGGGSAQVSISDASMVQSVNEWIFCCTNGAYSEAHHLQMVNGVESVGYAGTPQLLAWAEIDFRQFAAAVAESAKRHPLFNVTPGNYFVCADSVKYNKVDEFTRLRGDISNYIESNNPVESVLSKPERFSPENEFRVVLRLNAPHGAPPDAKPVFLRSQDLKGSILRFGFLTP